jgi:hypothetical protein
MRIVETDATKNLASVLEDIAYCAKLAGHEAARGKKGSRTILHDEIENIRELLRQCEVLEKEE